MFSFRTKVYINKTYSLLFVTSLQDSLVTQFAQTMKRHIGSVAFENLKNCVWIFNISDYLSCIYERPKLPTKLFKNKVSKNSRLDKRLFYSSGEDTVEANIKNKI